MPKQAEVTLKRSLIGANKRQKAAAAALGLRKINQSRRFQDGPAFRGQARVIKHLVSVKRGG